MFLSFSGPKNPRVISQTRKIVQAITQGSSRRAVLVIGLVATLAMAPELATGLTVTDNFRFNLSWPEQFAELFRPAAICIRAGYHGAGPGWEVPSSISIRPCSSGSLRSQTR